ncbi:MAG: hypothetical protein WC670_05815 [Pseudolabrys sp.]|jgi:hypothetical protein
MTWKIPFLLLDRHTIKELPATASIAGFQALLKLNEPYYVLVVSGIASIEEANKIFDQMKTAFFWMTTEVGLMAQFSEDLQAHYPSDPVEAAKNLSEVTGVKFKHIDGIVDGGRPTIFEEGKQLSVITSQRVDFGLGHSPKSMQASRASRSPPSPAPPHRCRTGSASRASP